MSQRAQQRRKARERARRSGPDAPPKKSPTPPPEQVPVSRVAALAAALALVGGFLEVGEVAFLRHRGLVIRLSDQFAWMAPAAHLLAFAAVTALLLAGRRAWPRLGTPAVTLGVLVGMFTMAVVGMYEPLYAAAVALLAVGVGTQAGRLARGRFGRALFRGAPPAAAVLGLAFVAVLIGALVAPGRREAKALAALSTAGADRPNILLIVMDAVRAPSTGLYNPYLSNTPVLGSLAAGGVVFERATSVSPWTLPAHATLFTGRWPTEHGADWYVPLDSRYPTLAERLAKAGYATAGFTGNLVFTGHEEGLARGYARYQDYPLSPAQLILSASLGRHLANLNTPRRWLGLTAPLNEVPAEQVTDRFLHWHDRHPNRPFFAFLNYYDAHEPFPPAPGGPSISPLINRHTLPSGTTTHFAKPAPQDEDRFLRGYRAGYEAAIGSIDRELGRLFRELERRGELDRTVVVVTSDHGDLMGEHRLVGHNSSLYLPALWVPLVIRYPAGVPRGLRIPNEVSLRNVPATLLDLAGVDDGGAIPGRSLRRYWATAPGDAPEDTLYAHLTGGPEFPPWAPVARGPEMHSLIREHHHYLLNGDGSEELYDLDHDPAEARNLAGEPSRAVLMDRLRAIVQGVPGVRMPARSGNGG